MIKTAVLVDGAFFLKRYKYLAWRYPQWEPEKVANNLCTVCRLHLYPRPEDDRRKLLTETDSDVSENRVAPPGTLYRIFYYDCEPLELKIHHPVTQKFTDYSKTWNYDFRKQLFEELKKKRKVAIRMGRLTTFNDWRISSDDLKALIKGELTVNDLTEKQVTLDFVQKGVDMKIGIDIASLALKKQVERIVLISGDSDFVPAAKLARREGIDFVLDPLWKSVHSSLHEHIDGLRSVIRPKLKHSNRYSG